jgi:hypothetical protein
LKQYFHLTCYLLAQARGQGKDGQDQGGYAMHRRKITGFSPHANTITVRNVAAKDAAG